MEVYLEYVIIDNLIINYLLLKCSLLTSRVKSKFYMKLISAVLGTVVAVVLPLFNITNLSLILIKILLSIIMVLWSGKYISVKDYVKTYFFFLFYTFLCGGGLIGIFYLVGIDYKIYFSLNYQSFMPIGLSILFVYLISSVSIKFIRNLLLDRDIFPFIRKCEIIIDKRKIAVNGYIDSGNRLFDKRTGLPIIVASKSLMESLTLKVKIMYYTTIKIQTVGEEFNMQIYLIDKLKIYNGGIVNTFNNVLLGKGDKNFNENEKYDLLLHPSLF